MGAADDAVDGLRDHIFRELLTFMMEDARTIPRALHLILISHLIATEAAWLPCRNDTPRSRQVSVAAVAPDSNFCRGS